LLQLLFALLQLIDFCHQLRSFRNVSFFALRLGFFQFTRNQCRDITQFIMLHISMSLRNGFLLAFYHSVNGRNGPFQQPEQLKFIFFHIRSSGTLPRNTTYGIMYPGT
jgi:hypothetical protein